jgi:sulfatase modifying factor 1
MRSLLFGLVAVMLAATFAASSAHGISVDWVDVGSAGNSADATGFGSVGYEYRISRYEVTVSQYAEFLNVAAQSDPSGLYDPLMGIWQGVTQSGTDGSYSYTVESGRGTRAMGHVSFDNALRFTNWLNNGQGSALTDSGAYDLSGGSLNNGSIERSLNAEVFLPSEDEWYKAAYYDAAAQSFLEYPTFSNIPGTCSGPSASSNTANCGSAAGFKLLTNVGSYPNSGSPYGTFDQGGNVWEWNESWLAGESGGLRGGGNGSNQATGPWGDMRASYRGGDDGGPVPGGRDIAYGFRVAAVIPEPSAALLLGLGLVGLSGVSRLTPLSLP